MEKEQIKKEIIKYFERTLFSFEDQFDDGFHLLFTTREHGDMMNDEPGEEDMQDARNHKKSLIGKYNADAERIKVCIEGVDEWTHIDVIIN